MSRPDAPVNLSEIISIRSYTSVSFSWTNGQNTNGSPIIDYQISMAVGQGSTSYSVIQTGVLVQSFTAYNLTVGQYYSFIVQSRNQFGLSVASSSITL